MFVENKWEEFKRGDGARVLQAETGKVEKK